jgi:hypothetical protein
MAVVPCGAYGNKLYKLVPIIGTIMESKENIVLGLFFNSPTREWHFEEILKEAKIARSRAVLWLEKFVREGLVRRVKERYRMPYYVGNCESPEYQNRKRIFGLGMLQDSGLLNHLASLGKAKSVILFGSFSRWDWHESSDIDVFIYGDPEGLKIASYEFKLHRNIQLFICQENRELNVLGPGLIKNIISGDLIKGDLNFVKVAANA